GGSMMECSLDITGTLRAQEHGHQPLIYENHGIDSRYTGPHRVAPTMSARYGTGGNNVPLVEQEQVCSSWRSRNTISSSSPSAASACTSAAMNDICWRFTPRPTRRNSSERQVVADGCFRCRSGQGRCHAAYQRKDPERFGLVSGGNLFTRHSFDRPALLPWLRRGGA